MKSSTRLMLIVVLCILAGSILIAEIPQTISYQGRLTDNAGVPVADGSYDLTFTIYDDSTTGIVLWSELQSVTTNKGLFSVNLGSNTSLDDSVFSHSPDLFLGIQLAGSPSEMSPRARLTSSAFSFRALHADTADYAHAVPSGEGGWVDSGSDVILSELSDKVGIGTQYPGAKLHVEGDILVSGKATIGLTNINLTSYGFVAGASNQANGNYSSISGGLANTAGLTYAHVGGGFQNLASNWSSTVGGGEADTVLGVAGTIAGGLENYVGADYASIIGGQDNKAMGNSSTIGGGKNNRAHGNYSVIIGGGGPDVSDTNSVIGDYSIIGGGNDNYISGEFSVISGGSDHDVSGHYATIAGGANNVVSADYSSVSGGFSNSATNWHSTVGGGIHNHANGEESTVAGGSNNKAEGHRSSVGGGKYNRTHGNYSVVAGGGGPTTLDSNSAIGDNSAVGGGSKNRTFGEHSTISGGRSNTATADYIAVGGGSGNNAIGIYSTIGGGASNEVHNIYATVGGGGYNTAGDEAATVGGGRQNHATNFAATVGGGMHNFARGYNSVVSGGGSYWIADSNSAIGDYSTIPGGIRNCAVGDYSFAAGNRAKANHDGTFVWADNDDVNFESTDSNQFLIRARGGVGIGLTSPKGLLDLTDNSDGIALHFSNADRDIAWQTGQSLQLGDWNGSIFNPRLRINADGNVGVNTTAPNGALHVKANSDGMALHLSNATGDISWPDNNTLNIGTWNGSTFDEHMRITAGGNVGIGVTSTPNILTVVRYSATDPIADAWTTWSSRRWKDNIKPIENALEKVQRLRGVSFNWLETGEPDIGLIAEEVGEVIPEIVAYEANGVDAQSVEYARLVALLIESVKEQQISITEQQNSIEKLESEIEELKSLIKEQESK